MNYTYKIILKNEHFIQTWKVTYSEIQWNSSAQIDMYLMVMYGQNMPWRNMYEIKISVAFETVKHMHKPNNIYATDS